MRSAGASQLVRPFLFQQEASMEITKDSDMPFGPPFSKGLFDTEIRRRLGKARAIASISRQSLS